MTTTNRDRLPHFDQYFGPWAIQEEPFRAAVEACGKPGFSLSAHLRTEGEAAQAAAWAARGYTTAGTEGNVAVVTIRGSMMKHQTSMGEGASTVLARRAIRAAVADNSINGILLLIDSPGGTVAGTRDLAEEVANANKQKPVIAYIEDLGASAAYWVASQASKVHANATALVGSIGTFAVLYDFSKQCDKLGVKVHVVRAGKFKGMGTEGTEITDEQLAYWQGIVDKLNDLFLAGVSAGRKLPLSKITELADGRVHVGIEAQRLGLIDGVQTFAATVNQLSNTSTATKRTATATSSDNPPLATTTPATAARGNTTTSRQGSTDTMTREQTIQAFNTALREKMAGGLDRKAATRVVARQNPQLHREFVKATNAQHKAGLIDGAM